jgi:hypothetical protein
MSPDSILQFSQSLSNKYTDWHPPAMAAFWHLFVALKSPLPMLIGQQVLLWVSLFMISRKFVGFKYYRAILIMGFLPWISNFSGVIWKDVWMGFLLLLAIALIIRNQERDLKFKNIYALFSLLFVLFAVLFRHNAILPAFPIIILNVALLLDYSIQLHKFAKKKVIIVISTIILLFGFGITQFVDNQLLNAEATYPENAFMIDDLSYLSIKNGKSEIPGIKIETIQDCREYLSGLDPYSGKISCIQKYEEWIQSGLASKSLTKVWIKAVIKQPWPYLKFRIKNFSYYIKSPGEEPWYILHPETNSNPFGIVSSNNFFTKINHAWVMGTAKVFPFLFLPYFWLAINIFMIYLVAKRSSAHTKIATALTFSSLLNFFSIFVSAGGADFRYSYWSVIALTLTILILILSNKRLDYFAEKLNLKEKKSLFVLLPVLIFIIFSGWFLRTW